MTPALSPGDYLLARLTRGTPRRGEIIVFEQPEVGFVVKRIVALGGETIRASGGTLFINDDPNIDRWAVGLTAPFDPFAIPDGQVWVMGDRREISSIDSRTVGPLEARPRWKAIFRYFPVSRTGVVR